MPKVLMQIGIILGLTALLPLSMVYRAHYRRSEKPRIHLIWHMDNQGRYKAQQENDFFPDHRAMRGQIAGTVARVPEGAPSLDDSAYWTGLVDESQPAEAGNFVARIPVSALPEGKMTRAVIDRGHQRFDIYCSVCHGLTGNGKGVVQQRTVDLVSAAASGGGAADTTAMQAAVLYDQTFIDQPDGQIFNTISSGKFTLNPDGSRNYTMPSYGAQIPTADRWAIVAYVRALQHSASGLFAEQGQLERARLQRKQIQDEQEAREAEAERQRIIDAARKDYEDKQAKPK